jgi:lysozyme
MLMSTSARVTMRNTEKKVMKYYDDGGKGKGNCTWGIGTLAHRGPCTAEELARVVTDADVEREFNARLRVAERGVDSKVKVTLTQDQFDALVSLTYNLGVKGASRIYAKVNALDFKGAADEISSLVYGKQIINGKQVKVRYPGLVSRRAYESAPFRTAAKTTLRSAAR